MHVDSDRLRLSPSDLSSFLGCRHRTGLDLAVVAGALEKPVQDDVRVQALRDRGAAHEQAYVEALRAADLEVVLIASDGAAAGRAAATLDAMRQGVDVVVQAALRDEEWTGYADILRRVDLASALGAWSYEPYDTKLARETRGGSILQLATYVDLLEHIQGVRPERFYVVSPGPANGHTASPTTDSTFRVSAYRIADFAAYFRFVRRQFRDLLALDHQAVRDRHYPEPVEACEVCRWQRRCHRERRRDDHLSFIAGATRLQRQELDLQGYSTLAAAAAMPVPVAFTPARGSRDGYTRLAHQARLQHRQRTEGRPVHELLDLVPGQGLARLPEPSAGDLFLDLEGARFARDGGREYLFGMLGATGATGASGSIGAVRSCVLWATNDAEERAAFETTIDAIVQHWDADPGMHVYHFGHHEPSALKKLMGRYATRGDELDRLLRGERFVDLHAVVRQALRAGVESYSIKQLEPFYGFERDIDLREAALQRQNVELALEADALHTIDRSILDAVELYNRDDCRSAASLRDWLEQLRTAVVDAGTDIARPVAKDGAASVEVGDLEARQQTARERLLRDVPADASAPDHPQHPHWLLAYLIDWHRRENKAEWW